MENKYSIVIPVYNSENIVSETVSELIKVCENNSLFYEIILVNDNSRDDSWKVILAIAKSNRNVIAINLLKNYGQHSAVLCGFAHAQGDYIITMDDDMQNPPEEILHLIRKMNEEDYDSVFGEFRVKRHGFVRGIGTKVVNFLNNRIFNKPKDIVLTNFRIIKREVINRILTYRTGFPYIPGLVILFSNKIGNVKVEHRKRAVGKSNYNLFKILKLVSRLLINYSSFPLRVMTFIGSFIALISFLFGLFNIIKTLFFGSEVQGWTTLIVILSFLNGFIILMLGLMGEYVSRILRQVSAEESYHIKEVVDER